MTVIGGPDIVEDGLVLYLDAANPDSYPGSGTTWKDLSGNEHDGTLLNGVSYSTENGGSLTFDGVDDKVITTPISGNNSFTYEIVCKKPSNTGYLIYRNNNMNYTDNSDNGDIYITNTGTLGFHVEYGTTGNDKYIEQAGVISENRYYNVVATYNYNEKTQKLYLDGTLLQTLTNSAEPANLFNNNNFYSIGVQGYSNHTGQQADRVFFNSNIVIVKIYNRDLTLQEIQQNYNATKSRFGL